MAGMGFISWAYVKVELDASWTPRGAHKGLMREGRGLPVCSCRAAGVHVQQRGFGPKLHCAVLAQRGG